MPHVDPIQAMAQPHRRRLYEEIRHRPGRTLSELMRSTGLSSATVLWHTQKLQHARLILSENYLGNRLYHAADAGLPGKRLGRAVALLQDPRSRRIVTLAQAGHGAEDIRRILAADRSRVAAILEAIDVAAQHGHDYELHWGMLEGFTGLHKVPSPV